MFRSMRSDRFPVLLDYADASVVERRVKPYVKGKHKGAKPLAERSRSWLKIKQVQMYSGEPPSVAVQMYNTDLITYKQDGTIELNMGGYLGYSTTHEVAGRIMGTEIFSRHGRVYIQCANGKMYLLRSQGKNVFTRGAGYTHGALNFINPPPTTMHMLKRKEYNALRRSYKPFENYLLSCIRLRGHIAPSNEEVKEVLGTTMYEPVMPEQLMEFINWSGEDYSEGWYKASLVIMRRCAGRRYWSTDDPVNEKKVLRILKDLICTHHKDELFYVTEHTDGRIHNDVNGRKYFSDRRLWF